MRILPGRRRLLWPMVAVGLGGLAVVLGGLWSVHVRWRFVSAAQNGDIVTVRKMLDAGMDPDVVSHIGGIRAISMAAYSGNIDVVRLLLDRGSNPNYGVPQAILMRRADILRLLGERGARVPVTQPFHGPYFPPGIFEERGESFKEAWYGKALERMQEPAISAPPLPSRETYRFLWLRTFHRPIAVRIEMESDNAARLFAKALTGHGGYDAGRLAGTRTREIGPPEVRKFREVVRSSGFWEAPVLDSDRIGMDGAQWIIEGVKDGRYHVVDRWSPDEGGIRELGLSMLQMSELDKGDVY